MCSALETIDRL